MSRDNVRVREFSLVRDTGGEKFNKIVECVNMKHNIEIRGVLLAPAIVGGYTLVYDYESLREHKRKR